MRIDLLVKHNMAQIPFGWTRHDLSCRVVSRRNVSSLFQRGRQRSDGDRLYSFRIFVLGVYARPEYETI